MSHRKRMLEDLDQDIRDHIARETQDNIDRGMSPEEARYAALRKFGNISQAKEDTRAVWSVVWLEQLWQDARYGLRTLRKNPGFTAVAVLTLALGIGANTAIFSVVNGILLAPLPYASWSRLVNVGGLDSYPEIREVQGQSSAFQRFAVIQGGAHLIEGGGAPVHGTSSRVSSDFFSLLGVTPLLGRPILPQDTESGGAKVAVMSYGLWKDIFGGDPEIVGRKIFFDSEPYTVIGVMPKDFDLGVDWLGPGSQPGVWTPLPAPTLSEANSFRRFYQLIARLNDGVSQKGANAQLQTISARLAAKYPKSERGIDLTARGLRDTPIFRAIRIALFILLGAVGFVLLISCVNVSALLLARAWARQKEVAIRRALGATQMRIVRQLLTESVLLALAGGALGLLFSAWGIRAIRGIAPPYTPRVEHLKLDGNVLWFALGISLLAAFLFGLAPALRMSLREKTVELKKGMSGSFAEFVGSQRLRLRGALVIVETALAVILVVGAGLMIRSFDKLIRLDTGVRTDHVLTMNVQLTLCKADNWDNCPPVPLQILDRIRAVEGVQQAAMTYGGAFGGGSYSGSGLYVEGREADQNPSGVSLWDRAVTPDYFDSLGMRLLSGRVFESSDWKVSPPVAIVSRSFARAFIPGDPLGKGFSTHDDWKTGQHQWMEIVGVVNDVHPRTVNELLAGLTYYTPYSPRNDRGSFIVRTSFDPMAMAATIRQQVWAVDKHATIDHLETLDQVVEDSVAAPKFQAVLLGTFGAIGLLLAAIGIYGVISFSVVQRTHEIGVRMALGARPRDVMRLIIGQGASLAIIGIGFGLAGAWALTRVLRGLLFEIKPNDPATFIGVAVLLLLTALLASYIPARRAMRVDPLVALRHE